MVKFSAQTTVPLSDTGPARTADGSMTDGDWYSLEQLESKVTQLVELCTVLRRENGALRAQQHNWTSERAKLIEKNELAKSSVESMITRLKTLETDS